MTETCAQLHAATVYNCVVVSNDAGVKPAPRITVFSGRPIGREIESIDVACPETPGDNMVDAMLRASGVKWRITFRPADGAMLALITKNGDGKAVKVAGYDRFVVFSKEDVVFDSSDSMPAEVFRKLANMEPDTTEELTAEELLDRVQERARITVELDKKHGMPELAGLTELLSASVDEMRAALVTEANSGGLFSAEASAQGVERTHMDSDSVSFVPAMATDFKGASLMARDGSLKTIALLRVSHVDPPKWIEADGAEKKQGVVGFWTFDTCALAEDVGPAIEWTTATGMKVAVRDARSINPAGLMAIPLPVWKSMVEDDRPVPEEMDEIGANAFNEANALSIAQSIAMGEAKGRLN